MGSALVPTPLVTGVWVSGETLYARHFRVARMILNTPDVARRSRRCRIGSKLGLVLRPLPCLTPFPRPVLYSGSFGPGAGLKPVQLTARRQSYSGRIRCLIMPSSEFGQASRRTAPHLFPIAAMIRHRVDHLLGPVSGRQAAHQPDFSMIAV